jgi:hypothetical protein
LEIEPGACAGGCESVLAGTGLGDYASFTHSLGEQGLAESVVYFVRTGIGQSLEFEEYLRSAEFTRCIGGVHKGCRPSYEIFLKCGKLCLERSILQARFKVLLQLSENALEFRHYMPASIRSKVFSVVPF